MTYLILVVVTMITIGSQLLLKKGVARIDFSLIDGPVHYILMVLTSPYVVSAIFLQGIGFLLWILVVSKLKLGIAFALSGSFFYILMALCSWYFFGEQIKTFQWIGLLFISIGVVFLTSVI